MNDALKTRRLNAWAKAYAVVEGLDPEPTTGATIKELDEALEKLGRACRRCWAVGVTEADMAEKEPEAFRASN